MCEHHGGSARLIIATPSADGSIHTRHWTICALVADDLAAHLGAPDVESLASAEGVATVNQAMQDVPGVVRTHRGR